MYSHIEQIDKAEDTPNRQGLAEGDALENIINSMARMLGIKLDRELKGDKYGNTWHIMKYGEDEEYTGREDLHQAIAKIAQVVGDNELAGKFTIQNCQQNKLDAYNNFADFLAIYTLSPFTLTAKDKAALENYWQSNTELADIYDKWKKDKEAVESSTNEEKKGRIYFTEAYIEQRSQMLLEKMSADSSNQKYDKMNTKQSVVYQDQMYGLSLGKSGENKAKVIFGADSENEETPAPLTGGSKGDYLFGGSGNDTLIGGVRTSIEYDIENDSYENYTLDDNQHDHLEGGAGYDTYYVGNKDTLLDSNGSGCIYFNGRTEKLGTLVRIDKRSVWYELDENGKKTGLQAIRKNGNDLLLIENGVQAEIRNFFQVAKRTEDDGYTALDITLSQAEEEYMLWRGDIRPHTNEKGNYAVDWADRAYRNDKGEIINGTVQVGFEDVIYGQANANNKIYGLDGNDTLHGANEDDIILGGNGCDLIFGGRGMDTIYGGCGDDYIFTGKTASLRYRQNDDDHWKPKYEGEIIISAARWGVYRLANIYDKDGNALDINLFELDNSSCNPTKDEHSAGDMVYGGEGDDYIRTGSGNDIVWGDEVNDETGEKVTRDGNDGIAAGAGNDLIYGGGGYDYIYGDGSVDDYSSLDYVPADTHGNDTIYAGNGADTVIGGGGDDITTIQEKLYSYC